jgi:hypothetical protein
LKPYSNGWPVLNRCIPLPDRQKSTVRREGNCQDREELPLSDEDKWALIEFMKTF